MSIEKLNSGVKLENKHAVYMLSDRAVITNVYTKPQNTDIADSPGPCFCHLTDKETRKQINPVGLATDAEGLLTVEFDDGYEATIKTEVFDEYITFELLSDIPPLYYSFTFAHMKLNYQKTGGDSFVSVGYAMSLNTHHNYFPSGEARAVKADCFTGLGTRGAKIAVITAPYSKIRGILKRINDTFADGSMPVSSTGGANALDYSQNYGDYVIISDSDPSAVGQWIEFYKRYSVDQLDFHQGGATFRQGDFVFYKTGSAAGFRSGVSDPLAAAGILSGLHSYSFYIDYNASHILKEPQWQSDLEVMETFTLAQDIGAGDSVIETIESTGDLSTYYGFMSHNTPFILIGNELIRITVDTRGFAGCQRGQGGTSPAEHKAGAKISHIGGYYGMIAPRPGSELFYHIARETARTYNEGGFRMIYLDAFDGLSVHTAHSGEKDYTWYYLASFVNELLAHTDVDPILEYSTIVPSIWSARGRGGAWDTPSRAYKEWNRLHLKSNRELMDRHYTTTFGWYNFYPVNYGYPGNFNVKYKYFDDVDFMGSIALAYNISIVYNGLTAGGVKRYPALERNMERYLVYSKLRKSGYFSEEIKRRIREGTYEYRLEETDGGKYAFYEKHYLKGKLHAVNEEGRSAVSGINPFGEQEPFVRIEGLLSSDGEYPVMLMEFDGQKPLRDQPLSVQFKERDIKSNLALRVNVLGNNSGDAICIRLKGATQDESGVSDYLIKLDFEGRREFILAEIDNGEFNHLSFDKSNGLYEVYRANVNYDRLTDVQVYLHGACEGVLMSDIEAVRHIENPVINPTVRVGNSAITFECTVNSTEYLEYTPGEGAVIYDAAGNGRGVDNITGKLAIPSGAITADLSCISAGEAPVRAALTLGLTGQRFDD
ncbi:MAG: hypothetical protein PHZ09_02230 [Eubacteriales bacterium]|nr:hypothetical protein [Eubacteriales bacterium]